MTTWTSERPTQPGKYWLSLEPNNRVGTMKTSVVSVTLVDTEGGLRLRTGDGLVYSLDLGRFTGALWAYRNIPDDPFELRGRNIDGEEF